MQIECIDFRSVEEALPLFHAYRAFYGEKTDIEKSRNFLTDRLKLNEIILFLAKDAYDKPIGFTAIYKTFSSVSAIPLWVLNDLYVIKEYRRQGVATSLMQHVEAHAKEHGIKKLKLQTLEDNDTAQRLYEVENWEKSEFLTYFKTITDV